MGFTDRFSVKVKDTTGEFTKGECMVHEEILDVEGRIVELVGHLISAQWDSPTLQKEIEKERKHYHFLLDQLEFAEGEKVQIREDLEK